MFKSIGPSLWISFGGGGCLFFTLVHILLVASEGGHKTSFVKFKISNNLKHNIDETHSKQPNIYRKIHIPMDF
jgi:hypothetical protein